MISILLTILIIVIWSFVGFGIAYNLSERGVHDQIPNYIKDGRLDKVIVYYLLIGPASWIILSTMKFKETPRKVIEYLIEKANKYFDLNGFEDGDYFSQESQSPRDYIFAYGTEDGGYFIVCEEEYWNRIGYIDDSGFDPDFLLQVGFHRLCDSTYEFVGSVADGKQALKSLGLKEVPEMVEKEYSYG